MNTAYGHVGFGKLHKLAMPWLMVAAAMVLEHQAQAQPRESVAGEAAAQALKRSNAEEDYNLQYGPVRFQTGARLAVGYTDNVFFSENKDEDFLINPEITLGALWPITEMNTLRLSVGIGYEYYLENSDLNSDAPLINPDSELVFNVFAAGFRIRLRDKFSYQESLFFNTVYGESGGFFNFNDVGRFSRLDNFVGVNVEYDLEKVVFSAGYDHEDFRSTTARFDYLDRSSEWFTATAAYLLGDHAKAGAEGQASLHNYMSETTLDDHFRVRGGPFIELTPMEKLTVRFGGGYDTGQYDGSTPDNSDYETWYGYGRVSQETRLFNHSVTAGREHLLGSNANNLRTTYVRYAITSPIIEHVELGANFSVNFAKEFGGEFEEDFTYYRAGARVTYQFHKYWHTGLAYDFLLKNSDLALRDFDRNRVSLELAFSF